MVLNYKHQYTTIELRKDTKLRLDKFKRSGMSYDKTITEMIDELERLLGKGSLVSVVFEKEDYEKLKKMAYSNGLGVTELIKYKLIKE